MSGERVKRPGAGWHFSHHGWHYALVAIPRIRDGRLHARFYAGVHRGFCLGLWWTRDEDDEAMLDVGLGFVTVSFFVAKFWPSPSRGGHGEGERP